MMRIISKVLIFSLLFFLLTACSNEESTGGRSEDEINEATTEANEKEQKSIIGYWKQDYSELYDDPSRDLGTLYIQVSEKDNLYTINIEHLIKYVFEPTSIEDNLIEGTIIELWHFEDPSGYTDMKNEPDEEKEIVIQLSEDYDNMNLYLPSIFEELNLSRVDIENMDKANPLDLLGNWMNEYGYMTITSDNNRLSLDMRSYEDNLLMFETEILEIIENKIFLTLTDIYFYPPDADIDAEPGLVFSFEIIDDSKIIIMNQEYTKTDMTFEEAYSQMND